MGMLREEVELQTSAGSGSRELRSDHRKGRRVSGPVAARSSARRPSRPRHSLSVGVAVAAVSGRPRARVAVIQRARLLTGALAAIEEHGYQGMTVAQVTSRAGVSRRTFYELFEDREACLAALIEDTVGAIEEELARASLDGLRWRERVCGGLWTILCFLDREPALARVCVVQTLHAGPRVRELRRRIFKRLERVLDEGRAESAAADCGPLTAQGVVGAALAILYASLLRGEHRPLTDLQSELAGTIVLPYLGRAAARRERARPVLAPQSGTPVRRTSTPLTTVDRDPLQGIPIRMTYRTARVLECIAEQPGVSNREVADRAGISDQGQISKLLARLQRLGLAANMGIEDSRGAPNAWRLTPLGEQLTRRLRTIGGHREGVDR
jgi:AcrR family transcriptional regulator/DNA-binding MarR family transcriptional regulator